MRGPSDGAAEPPAFGEWVELRPGLLWTRMPLPARIGHVNCYLLDDGDGWVAVDTGINDRRSRAAWRHLLSRLVVNRPLKKVFVTHHHADHAGLAGWLCRTYGATLAASQTTWLMVARDRATDRGKKAEMARRAYYAGNGFDAGFAAAMAYEAGAGRRQLSALPPAFARVCDGDSLAIGGRNFEVLAGEGHSPEQLMLHCPAERLLLIADQVLSDIAPMVGVWESDPLGDPLARYLRSLEVLRSRIADDVLCLAGHRMPFAALSARCLDIVATQMEKCDRIEQWCSERPLGPTDIHRRTFPKTLTPRETVFAFSEVRARINFLLNQGRLVEREGCFATAVRRLPDDRGASAEAELRQRIPATSD